jgi:hypothetical protein
LEVYILNVDRWKFKPNLSSKSSNFQDISLDMSIPCGIKYHHP